MKKKLVLTAIIVLSVALLVAVSSSVAWLITDTPSVTNEFTPSNIAINLNETTSTYKMIPNTYISKDPKVEVKTDIPCYVFVKIEEVNPTSYGFDEFLEYCIADGWMLYHSGGNVLAGANIPTDSEDSYCIYREYNPNNSDSSWNVLGCKKGAGSTCPCVYVKKEVTKDMMDVLCGTGATNPLLTFTAVAVQQDNLSLTEAYNLAWGIIPTTPDTSVDSNTPETPESSQTSDSSSDNAET